MYVADLRTVSGTVFLGIWLIHPKGETGNMYTINFRCTLQHTGKFCTNRLIFQWEPKSDYQLPLGKKVPPPLNRVGIMEMQPLGHPWIQFLRTPAHSYWVMSTVAGWSTASPMLEYVEQPYSG